MGWTLQRAYINCAQDEYDIIERAIGIGSTGYDGAYNDHSIAAKGRVGRTFYYAIRYKPEKDYGYVMDKDGFITYGLVVLTSYRDGEYGYKFIDEQMGPCETEAPQKVLNALSEFTDEYKQGDRPYAESWRNDCRLFHENRRKNNALLKEGVKLRAIREIPYSNVGNIKVNDLVTVTNRYRGIALIKNGRLYGAPRKKMTQYFELA